MHVIGFAGQMYSGKDTGADHLQAKLNQLIAEGNWWDKSRAEGELWHRKAFAANVKKVFCDTFGVDMDFVEKWKVIDEPPPGFDMTVRKALQFIGDGFRKIMSTIWLDLAFRGTEARIISDMRYINEFVRVYKEGGCNILIARPDKLNDDPNGSEAEIRPYVDWCLANTTGTFVVLEEVFKTTQPTLPHMDKFHLFVRNTGTKEDLYSLIDNQLLPYIKDFDFNTTRKIEG